MTQSPENRALTDKFMLRLPDGMRDRIKTVAEANNRSMNAEIVATLEEKYPEPQPESYLIARLQHLIDMFDKGVTSEKYSPEQRERLLPLIKDMILEVIEKMTKDELKRVRAEFSFPGELYFFEDWPPQGWRSGGSDAGYGGDGTGDGYGDGGGAYGDSDGNGDGMGGSANNEPRKD